MRSALFTLLVLTSQLPLRASPPLLAPPPVVQRQGQAFLSGGALCPELQSALESAVGPEERAWSVSVLDQRGQLLADLNGGVPRVPASNQKLVSTAFARDRLGPDFRLKTQLLRHADGTLEIVGEGIQTSALLRSRSWPWWPLARAAPAPPPASLQRLFS